MKPAPFDYLAPENLDEALDALGEHGSDARILAGGQSLAAMLNMRLLAPELLIDIARIQALDDLRLADGWLEVGAAVTQAELGQLADLATTQPLLHLALPHVGHYQTRNRGTVCGSIAHADPSSELPLCLLTLGGDVVLRRRGHRRVLGASDFFVGLLTTACRNDEMIEAVRFPDVPTGAGFAFNEVALRHGDFAIVAIAAMATAGDVRVGVGGVADRVEARDWPVLGGDALDDALNALAWELGGYTDIHATARYRRQLIRRIGRRTIEEALACRG